MDFYRHEQRTPAWTEMNGKGLYDAALRSLNERQDLVDKNISPLVQMQINDSQDVDLSDFTFMKQDDSYIPEKLNKCNVGKTYPLILACCLFAALKAAEELYPFFLSEDLGHYTVDRWMAFVIESVDDERTIWSGL